MPAPPRPIITKDIAGTPGLADQTTPLSSKTIPVQILKRCMGLASNLFDCQYTWQELHLLGKIYGGRLASTYLAMRNHAFQRQEQQ